MERQGGHETARDGGREEGVRGDHGGVAGGAVSHQRG